MFHVKHKLIMLLVKLNLARRNIKHMQFLDEFKKDLIYYKIIKNT